MRTLTTGVRVTLPNSKKRTANYRSNISDAGYVRVTNTEGVEVTVSGIIGYSPTGSIFTPRGQNAYLVQG